MEIKECKYRLRCEMGACGKRAGYTICPARVGIRSSIHICGDCLAGIIAEGKKLAGGTAAATGGNGKRERGVTPLAGGTCPDGGLAAGGKKKGPPKRKSKTMAENTDGTAIIGGQLMFADTEATDGEFDGGKKVCGSDEPAAGLLRCARNDGKAADGSTYCDGEFDGGRKQSCGVAMSAENMPAAGPRLLRCARNDGQAEENMPAAGPRCGGSE